MTKSNRNSNRNVPNLPQGQKLMDTSMLKNKSNKKVAFDISNDSASGKDERTEAEDYLEILKPLGKISTLEEFFNYYVFMKKPD
eukprot:CAMPEP_0116873060 /NCGR_PEP_ID=MMETSP0463-20121206/4030_1 /TAXON_ID=181622 /ORGANISM="Strombidinopsis sp, Strain SopsisLIS2011" /LENGTH=83 /DNA_ID=CAMNT_0004514343 /DNA_START=184 /DNA_END=434 /DNA_ORIENTATION=-